MDFIQMEGAQKNSVVRWETVVKVERDLFREEWAVEPLLIMPLVVLEEELVLMELAAVEEREEEEAILEEAVEITKLIPVGVEVDPSTLEGISTTSVAIEHLDMVK